MNKLKRRPPFKGDAQEAAFWASHDSTEYIDFSRRRRTIFPRLKPLAETISLRLPKSLLDQLKVDQQARYSLSETPETISV
jgi:hypothetical protein